MNRTTIIPLRNTNPPISVTRPGPATAPRGPDGQAMTITENPNITAFTTQVAGGITTISVVDTCDLDDNIDGTCAGKLYNLAGRQTYNSRSVGAMVIV